VNNSNWKEKIARDIIALGSIIFYSLVVVRALIGPFWIFFYFLIIAAVVLLLIFLLHKEFDTYVARGLVLAAGTSLFYMNLLFAIFAFFIYLLMITSSYYLKNSVSRIIKGIIFAIISTAIAIFSTELITGYSVFGS
jgi:hypothetical protein